VFLIEVGDFTGIALRWAAHVEMRKVVSVGMAGKLAKLAARVEMTDFHRSEVDAELLGALAVEAGAPRAVVEAATETATARHLFDARMAHGVWCHSPCGANVPALAPGACGVELRARGGARRLRRIVRPLACRAGVTVSDHARGGKI